MMDDIFDDETFDKLDLVNIIEADGRFKVKGPSIKQRVYFVEDLQEDRYCPHRNKVLKTVMNNEYGQQKMQNEYDLYTDIDMKGLDLTNVVRIFGKPLDLERAWGILMERADRSLSDIIDLLQHKGKALEDENLLELFSQICNGARSAHNAGYTHHDLKPSNILVFRTPEGPILKIADFANSRQSSKTTTSEKGTPDYMAPEYFNIRFDTKKVSCHTEADIYSLGAILFQLSHHRFETPFEPLLGTSSMDGNDEEQPDIRKEHPYIQKRHEEEQTYLKERIKELDGRSDIIKEAILKCLQHKPENRYRSIDELMGALSGAIYKKAPGQDEDLEKFKELYQRAEALANRDDLHDWDLKTASPENAYELTHLVDRLNEQRNIVKGYEWNEPDIDVESYTDKQYRKIRDLRLEAAHKDEENMRHLLKSLPSDPNESTEMLWKICQVAFSWGHPVIEKAEIKGRKQYYYSPEDIRKGKVDWGKDYHEMFKSFFE